MRPLYGVRAELSHGGDFRSGRGLQECVRCNVCEVKLLTKAGVCRHDMEKIQPRLVQLQTAVSGD